MAVVVRWRYGSFGAEEEELELLVERQDTRGRDVCVWSLLVWSKDLALIKDSTREPTSQPANQPTGISTEIERKQDDWQELTPLPCRPGATAVVCIVLFDSLVSWW